MSNRVPPGDLRQLLDRAHTDNRSGDHDNLLGPELCSRCAMISADIELVVQRHTRKWRGRGRRR